MGTTHDLLIEGEPSRLILEALRKLNFVGDSSSATRFTGPLRGESGASFMRALSRIEGALLCADHSTSHGHPELIRTTRERRFDAMILMIMRATCTRSN